MSPDEPIHADIKDCYRCIALGVSARSGSPILYLCRKLVAAGHNPDRPLHAYRGDTLAVIVRAIGDGAKLEISAEGTGFRRGRSQSDARPVVRPTANATPHEPKRRILALAGAAS